MDMNSKKFINKGDHSLKGNSLKRNVKNTLAYICIGLATTFTVSVLLWIIGYVFINGIQKVNLDFLISNYESEINYVTIPLTDSGTQNRLGLILEVQDVDGENLIIIDKIEDSSKALEGLNKANAIYPLKKGDIIKKVGKKTIKGVSLDEVNELINNQNGDTMMLQVVRAGGGIKPMIITTLIMVVLSLLIACPIGIFAAIYLTEYAIPGRLVSIIRFATESLSGIPSIIYGLFGMVTFVILFKFNYSILAGALTLSIILLPVIIRQTEESIKAVPMSFREGSLGLGATKLQTIRKVVLPSAIPGIVVAVILSIGRIIGESAALLLTAGTAARVQGLFSSGATLTVKAYIVAKEEADITMACGIGTVIIVIILILNGLSKLISKKYQKVN